MPVGGKEQHHSDRIGWLRPAVLGANDGILSTSSLVLGVAAASATHRNLLIAGMAELVAGAMSMAAGEYVSVHSQADTEKADLDIERVELKTDNKGEHKELAAIYIACGLDPTLAKQVDWHGCPMICLYGAAWQRCNHSHGQRRVHRPYTKRLSASIASGRDLTLTCSARGRPRTAPEKLRSSYPSDDPTGIRFIRKFAPQSALSETCQQDFDSTLRVKVRLWKTP